MAGLNTSNVDYFAGTKSLCAKVFSIQSRCGGLCGPPVPGENVNDESALVEYKLLDMILILFLEIYEMKRAPLTFSVQL
jgi:hypothetical protein